MILLALCAAAVVYYLSTANMRREECDDCQNEPKEKEPAEKAAGAAAEKKPPTKLNQMDDAVGVKNPDVIKSNIVRGSLIPYAVSDRGLQSKLYGNNPNEALCGRSTKEIINNAVESYQRSACLSLPESDLLQDALNERLK